MYTYGAHENVIQIIFSHNRTNQARLYPGVAGCVSFSDQEHDSKVITIILNDDQLQLIQGKEFSSLSEPSQLSSEGNSVQVEVPLNVRGTNSKVICKVCTKEFATKRSRSTHMSIMHRMEGNKPTVHECHRCHKTYRTSFNLRRHKCKVAKLLAVLN